MKTHPFLRISARLTHTAVKAFSSKQRSSLRHLSARHRSPAGRGGGKTFRKSSFFVRFFSLRKAQVDGGPRMIIRGHPKLLFRRLLEAEGLNNPQ